MRFFIIIALFTCASLLAGCTEQAERPTEGYEKNFIRTLYPAKVTSSSTDSMVRLSRTSIRPGNSMI